MNAPLRTILLVAAFACAAVLAPASARADAKHPRIVSLVPSLTEDLFAIGAGAQVVGTSQFTDYPAAAAALPQVSSSGSIDAERIVSLHPGEVIGIVSQRRMIADLVRAGMHVTLMRDDSFDDIFVDLDVLGRISGHAAEARAVTKTLRARTVRLVRGVPTGYRPRTFVVLGVTPIFTVGSASYIAHLISLAGGVNAANDLHTAYGRYSAESLLAQQPDVIVADRYAGIAAALATTPWNALRAVRSHRVYVLDNADVLERPGPRYNDGLAWLIARLHPRPRAQLAAPRVRRRRGEP